MELVWTCHNKIKHILINILRIAKRFRGYVQLFSKYLKLESINVMATCPLSTCTKFSCFFHTILVSFDILQGLKVFYFRGNHTPYGSSPKSDRVTSKFCSWSILNN